MNYLGVDPGNSGGLAVLYEDGTAYTYKLEGATERDIWDWLGFRDGNYYAAIEAVHSSPQMGVRSAFTFGRSYGFLRGLLIACEIPFEEVSPQRWQRELGCLSRGQKNVTKSKAQQLFPTVKVTHAVADALLLATYAKRMREQGRVAS